MMLLGLLPLLALVPGTLCMTAEHAEVFRSRGLTVNETDDSYVIYHDGIPEHDYGPFPGSGNPNEVREQEHEFVMLKNPIALDTPGCVSMGEIGIAINGIPLYNPYTAQGYNAVEGDNKETFDDCDGHPQANGVYHYHKIPSCLYQGTPMELLAVMNDGYPIYGPMDENGEVLTSADLDFCHGRMYNGDYVYHMTYDFPYIIGCYHGHVNRTMGGMAGQDGGMGPPPDGMGPPPGGMRPPMNGDGGMQPPPDGGIGGATGIGCIYVNTTDPGLGQHNTYDDDDDDDDPSSASVKLASLSLVICTLFAALI